MFQAVMKNPEASAELVERLLGVRVKSVKYPKWTRTSGRTAFTATLSAMFAKKIIP